ncbi:MAG TPA: hypothetical protein VFO27_04795 [Bryobacteraceae bacterium]|nr:hypothetical protein [Bryobacteraceae bacterium]
MPRAAQLSMFGKPDKPAAAGIPAVSTAAAKGARKGKHKEPGWESGEQRWAAMEFLSDPERYAGIRLRWALLYNERHRCC